MMSMENENHLANTDGSTNVISSGGLELQLAVFAKWDQKCKAGSKTWGWPSLREDASNF